MPANSAQQLHHSLGIHPRPDYSDYAIPHLRHTGDLDRLREAAIDAGPGSPNYDAWVAALQQGADQDLPDVAAFSGAIPQSTTDQAATALAATRSSQQQWLDTDPLLHQIQLPDGRSLANAPAAEAHNLAALLAADGRHSEAHALLDAISRSTSSSLGIEWTAPDPQLEYTVGSTAPDVDPYTTWRQQQHSQPQTLAIKHASVDEQLFAGISPDGLSYNRADDWAADAAANTDD